MNELTDKQLIDECQKYDFYPYAQDADLIECVREIIAADRALRQAGPPFDGLNIDSLHDALIWMGICTPDSREMLAVTAIEHMNLLTRAVMKQKADMAPLEAAIAIPEQRQAGQEPVKLVCTGGRFDSVRREHVNTYECRHPVGTTLPMELYTAPPPAQEPPSKVLLEHSGCGHGTQVDQMTVRLNPGDKVVLVMGSYSAAIHAADSKR